MIRSILAREAPVEPLWEDAPLFTGQQLRDLDPTRIPEHIAFIPDGNRRWARKNFALPEAGHRAGADTLMDVIKASSQLGVGAVTFYIFSTENWLRPKREINAQIRLLEKCLIEQKQRMINNGVRFATIGEVSKFPPHIVSLLEEVEDATKEGSKIKVIFALNYGGRDDIRRAVERMLVDYEGEKFAREEVSEALIASYLDTAGLSDPDLLIRTSGESRISNFLLWQISYAEIYWSEVFWPEFTPRHLLEAIREYQTRDRRRGGS